MLIHTIMPSQLLTNLPTLLHCVILTRAPMASRPLFPHDGCPTTRIRWSQLAPRTPYPRRNPPHRRLTYALKPQTPVPSPALPQLSTNFHIAAPVFTPRGLLVRHLALLRCLGVSTCEAGSPTHSHLLTRRRLLQLAQSCRLHMLQVIQPQCLHLHCQKLPQLS